jgi:protein TonB
MTFGRLVCVGVATTALGLAQGVTVNAQATVSPFEPLHAVGAYVQSEPGPLEKQSNPITPENPIPRLALVIEPRYPTEASLVGARATISLRVTLDAAGRVGEIRTNGVPVLAAINGGASSDDAAAALRALIGAARRSVGIWLYDTPANPPIAFDVAVSFSPETKPMVVYHGPPGGSRSPQTEIPETPPSTEPVPDWAAGIKRVGGDILTKVKHVAPVYPAGAKEAGVQDLVVIEARVESDGRIVHARVVRSAPLLDQAALDAVLQWEFSPAIVDGNPVPVLVMIGVRFSLR